MCNCTGCFCSFWGCLRCGYCESYKCPCIKRAIRARARPKSGYVSIQGGKAINNLDEDWKKDLRRLE